MVIGGIKFMKKMFLIVFIIILSLPLNALSFFNKGHLAFDWYEKNYIHFMSIGMSVGEGAAGTIRRADDTLPELDVYLGCSSKESYFDIYCLLKKQYKKLYIQSLRLEWEDKTYVVLDNAVLMFPEKKYHIASDEEHNGNYFLTDEKYYWTCFNFLTPIKNASYPTLKPNKIFKDREDGDRFQCDIIIEYQLDDEPLKQIVLEHEVRCVWVEWKKCNIRY